MKEYLITLSSDLGNEDKFVIHAENAKLALEEAKKEYKSVCDAVVDVVVLGDVKELE